MEKSKKNKIMKFFYILISSVVFVFSISQNTRSSPDNNAYEKDSQQIVTFANAIHTISERYNVEIIVKGQQPSVKPVYDFERKTILKDLRKIISYYGIINHAVMYDNNSIQIFILNSGTNNSISSINEMEIKRSLNLGFDDNQPLTQEQMLLLPQAANSEEFEQPLSKEQMEQLQKTSNKNHYINERPLSPEQMILLQENAEIQGLAVNNADNVPLTPEQMNSLQNSDSSMNIEIDMNDESALTEEQMLLLEQDNK